MQHFTRAAAAILGAVAFVVTLAGPTSAATTPDGLTVSHRGVVQSSTLPHCAEEDGSGASDLPCTWNVGSTPDGNGVGLAYWIGHHGHAHYVWPTTPLGEGHTHRFWVTGAQARDFHRHADGPSRPFGYWLTCYVHQGPRATVHCPDGRWWDAS